VLRRLVVGLLTPDIWKHSVTFILNVKKIPRIHLDPFTSKATRSIETSGIYIAATLHKNPEFLHPYVTLLGQQQALKTQMFTLSARRFNTRKF
jgi:hypothetical protein